ncbi:doubled CXXCH motif-containing protein [Desulfitobacterium dichloroeliminans LMG P-21439]|uniref:Doubled CXXCH motif-containing protein n=1 Tax=Desulfitobacterium dichloroeliminans (strain LMG P-21439 / DCA1) TaxID=871963 RepID=L0F3P1_DESDL|nr:sulfate reduction electron transfer complex DsrMKJOP subunit DsrJ [Desulfitobacterium dichloroeliminans]AGA67797.1 doubled CXXCH motif-containing protein [Desulfitobacterium dichloroeliminans LMG P-21439]
MIKGGKTIGGLLIFLVIAILPFLYNMGKADAQPVIDTDTPVIQELGATECIESTEYMRENHMQLLVEWRDAVVRDGKTTYVNNQGKEFEMSLQSTCLNCHNDTPETVYFTAETAKLGDNQFCYSCHDFASVEPDCWSCHAGPREAK